MMAYQQVLIILLTICLVSVGKTTGNVLLNEIDADVNRENKADANTICQSATSQGYACSDCTNVVYCSKDESQQWITQPVGTCPSGKVCNKGNCVKSSACIPPDLPFICVGFGIFPDPVNCAKYHFCIYDSNNELQHFPTDCENNVPNLQYGYNPATIACSTKLVSNKCSQPYVITCKKNFDVGVISTNPTYYYVCTNYTTQDGQITGDLYPYQRACENGKRFSLSTETCL